MKYVSLIHALNLPCALETCGDWHTAALQWTNPHVLESDNSIWGDYGIEKNKKIPEHEGLFNIANHIRALLDLLYEGNFSTAQGMNEDFICNAKYDNEVFEKVLMMKNLSHWNEIDQFMTKEYLSKWINFKMGTGNVEFRNAICRENNLDYEHPNNQIARNSFRIRYYGVHGKLESIDNRHARFVPIGEAAEILSPMPLSVVDRKVIGSEIIIYTKNSIYNFKITDK